MGVILALRTRVAKQDIGASPFVFTKIAARFRRPKLQHGGWLYRELLTGYGDRSERPSDNDYNDLQEGRTGAWP
jgi:hypothetical protein